MAGPFRIEFPGAIYHATSRSICERAQKMKFNSRSLRPWLLIVPALLAAAFFSLPRHNCCDDADPELEALTPRAMAGDLGAIKALYQRAKTEGVQPMEEHWAMEGALRGDKALREAYVEVFHARIMDADRKQRLLAAMKDRSEMPGATCLLAMLGGASSAGAACK